MKKKIIILSSCITLISLIIIFVSSIFIIEKNSLNKAKEEIKSYMKIAISTYDKDNYENMSNILTNANNNLRITIIDLNGKVLFDSTNNLILDNHLDRTEVNNIGDVIIRYSDTLHQEVMYLAYNLGDTYLRLSLPYKSINIMTSNYINISIIVIIFTLILSIILLSYSSKRMLKPINNAITSLDNLVNNNIYSLKTIDDINDVINNISRDLTHKLASIDYAKKTTDIIINKLNIGIILLEFNKIKLINEYALNTFNITNKNIYDKSVIYLIRNIELEHLIYNKVDANKVIVINNRYYYFMISNINEDIRFKDGILISFVDVTDKEQLELTKKDFFENASHELKSPLTTIIGYSQLIVNDIISNKEELQDASSNILKEANRMNNIIMDMLDLASVESNINIEYELCDLNEIINELLDSFKLIIDKKNIKVNFNCNDVKLNTNHNYILTLFKNLISNALKYNKDNGSIEITLTNEYFQILDSGIGIKEEDKNRIFERFYRVDKKYKKDSSSTGLGLAICKHICQKLNYDISCESEFNKYTKFKIIFNKAQ